jgi:hypothetical protein
MPRAMASRLWQGRVWYQGRGPVRAPCTAVAAVWRVRQVAAHSEGLLMAAASVAPAQLAHHPGRWGARGAAAAACQPP